MHRGIYNGFVSATIVYKCKWCKRTETVVINDEDNIDYGQLDGWREYRPDCRSGMDLCSSDCEKGRDEAYNQAYANLEPVPRLSPNYPKGFFEEVERLRNEAL